ncbi:beta-1,6-N-acetylglucosaminyltransferase [Leeuwenhoekiella parthenopeia]|uniref:Peptide O-xylosyltransferase n=1 Tax=Leeuwenhoekiella parthenopeia TaxID=2890320 RepID=A0ABS8GZM1_9FLAO|nr:beta-1,6-N-acetylglucosaminyltransferase [Leeuwenhoekiella parthenopeia]MCC4214657.1 beta-1,6-N-acetylglucosaminyltransferase [Leeuwenhoekiella parthenopeia]
MGKFSNGRGHDLLLKINLEYKKNGRIVLLSGQDYPLWSNTEISKYFKKNPKSIFIDIEKFPVSYWKNGGYDRLSSYWFKNPGNQNTFINVASIWNTCFYSKKNLKNLIYLIAKRKFEVLPKILRKRKKQVSNLYGGSQWWSIPTELNVKVLDYIKSNPEFSAFHKYTLISDEIFFHTLFKIVADEDYCFQNSLTYCDWTKKGVSLPAVLQEEDLTKLIQIKTSKLYARKFDFESNLDFPRILNEKIRQSP